jgi:superfamily I DNA and RNA helicase
MTAAQIKTLRAVMNPVVLIDKPHRVDATDIKVLDIAQETKARCLPEGHQVIYGVAGSGKTVIALARAKHLAEDAERKILVLCFNNLLAQNLTSRLSGFKNVNAYTFHGWAKRNGIEIIDDELPEDHARRFLDAFEHGMVDDAGRYDAVIVDEAQLLPRDWLKCARLALKEQSPDRGSLLVVGDGSQSVFNKRPFTWKDAGIAASGRTTILKRNYRNTEEILRVAYPFTAAALPEGEDGPRRSTPMPECLRNGPVPELLSLRNRGEECDYAATLIRLWLMGGMMIRGRRETLRPSDIAVLFPTPGPQPGELAERLNAFTKAVVLRTYKDRLDQEAVRLIPIRRATGLQFRVVLLLWTDLLRSDYKDDQALLYMAMTRAEDVLVILHSGTSELISRIGAALEANGAPALH